MANATGVTMTLAAIGTSLAITQIKTSKPMAPKILMYGNNTGSLFLTAHKYL
jgi:hypothetical protein